MVQIETVEAGSPAASVGILPGDRIVTINGAPVRDVLDFHFLASDEDLSLELARGSERLLLSMPGEDSTRLGIALSPMKTRLCGNDCVFCFTYQNPEGIRPTLGVKDEDYRLSFLHGNFVTLSNLKEWEIRRIVEQRLSPIYISVHSMNRETRQRMIRARQERDIRPILDYFAGNGIAMHTQVVLVPGYNDGEDLRQTVRDLAAYFPHVQSLAVVPLGMTDHRRGLETLEPVTSELARATLADAERFQREFRRRFGLTWLYLADEWYRMLDRRVPPETHYDGYPQLENGIGMTRYFLNRLGRVKRLFPDLTEPARPASSAGVAPATKVTLLTGALFQPILERNVRAKLVQTGERVQVQVVGVPNDFFGRKITVAGLLVGRDILRALESVPDVGAELYLPSPVCNDDDIFLDDTPLRAIQETVGVPVHVGFRDRQW
jgi:putative radical SAM enzyme (TIGR03279 family)